MRKGEGSAMMRQPDRGFEIPWGALFHPGERPRGSAPWFPKNLYTRVRVPLGLPPGGDPSTGVLG